MPGQADVDGCAHACNLIGTCWGFYFDNEAGYGTCTIWKEPTARTSVEMMGTETHDASPSYAKCPDTNDDENPCLSAFKVC